MGDENLVGDCDGLKTRDTASGFQDSASSTSNSGDPGEERGSPVMGSIEHFTALVSGG